jgi:hypothetical protein
MPQKLILLLAILSTLGLGCAQEKPSSQIFVIDEKSAEEIWIDARGLDGASARAALFFGATPQSGSSGASGGNVTLIVKQLPSKVLIDARGGRGGNGASGARGRYGLPGADGKNAGFFSSATDGEDGSDGARGGDGSHGGHGGKGGKIRIVYWPDRDYDPRWQERFELRLEGGQGGEGGQAGLGGRGGIGGVGGKKFWSSDRKSSGQSGRDGERGREGLAGSPGESGEVEFIEIEDLRDFLLEEFERSS